jgi:hypothetical protein
MEAGWWLSLSPKGSEFSRCPYSSTKGLQNYDILWLMCTVDVMLFLVSTRSKTRFPSAGAEISSFETFPMLSGKKTSFARQFIPLPYP